MDSIPEKPGHTPGPWQVNQDVNHSRGLPTIVWGARGPGYGAVAYTFAPGLLVPDSELGEVDANARLIAAAPDLLAACEKLLRMVECFNRRHPSGDQQDLIAEAGAVIARAKGD